jgi:arylsulfatase
MESIKYGPWAGGQFKGMVKRHMALKQKYPDRPAVHDIPYKGIENLRPETKKLLEAFKLSRPKK